MTIPIFVVGKHGTTYTRILPLINRQLKIHTQQSPLGNKHNAEHELATKSLARGHAPNK